VKIRAHHYTLQPGPDRWRAARSPRSGALIEVTFDDGTIGYADIHPWNEFGHAPLEEHLASLGTEQPTHLANLALRHARTDAAARRAGVSLFDGLPEIGSHALFTDWIGAPRSIFEECAAAGYSFAKLKIGKDPQREAEALNKLADIPLSWRLDANTSFTGASALAEFLDRLSPAARSNIAFVEDPFAYEPKSWSAVAKENNLYLALDWELPTTPAPWPGAQTLVIKPASQDAFPLVIAAAHAGMKIVVTHSMDHPLGQSVALWTAMRLRQRHGELVREGGLQAVGLYASDAFGEQIKTDGPRTIPPPGTGFGFDELLRQIPWQNIG